MSKQTTIILLLLVGAAAYFAPRPAAVYRVPSPPIVQIPSVVAPEAKPVRKEAEPEDLRPPVLKIQWVPEAEAKKSGKHRWYHLTQSENCAHCVIADRMLATPDLVAASKDFAPVLIVDPKADAPFLKYYQITVFPTDLFVDATGKKKPIRYDGRPKREGVIGHAMYLMRFDTVKKKFAEPDAPVRVPQASVSPYFARSLEPNYPVTQGGIINRLFSRN